jgi:hypothetical protein
MSGRLPVVPHCRMYFICIVNCELKVNLTQELDARLLQGLQAHKKRVADQRMVEEQEEQDVWDTEELLEQVISAERVHMLLVVPMYYSGNALSGSVIMYFLHLRVQLPGLVGGAAAVLCDLWGLCCVPPAM